MSDLFELDVNDLSLNQLDDNNTVPLTHASDSSYPPSEISPNPPLSQPDAWMPRDQGMMSQISPNPPLSQPDAWMPRDQGMMSQYLHQPVSSSGMVTSTYNSYGTSRILPAGAMPPPGVGTTRIMTPHGVPRDVATSGIVSPQGVPPGMVPSQNIPRNGIPTNGQFVNASDPSGYRMTSSQPLPPHGNVGSSQPGLLQVQTQPMQNRSYIKTEPTNVRSTGYYCNSASMDSAVPRGMANGPFFPGLPAQNNTYRYQNKLNHVGLPQWTTAPPSPYSSGSSSTSSYDALHVQFSPTETLTSPFASPHDDSNDYNHGNALPLPGQPYMNRGHPQRSYIRPPPSFPKPFVDIPEIAPMGVVEELVQGMNHTSPLASRTTAGLTHL